ncbi:MAG: hypothetical protein ABI333_20030, partial [bacterium]
DSPPRWAAERKYAKSRPTAIRTEAPRGIGTRQPGGGAGSSYLWHNGARRIGGSLKTSSREILWVSMLAGAVIAHAPPASADPADRALPELSKRGVGPGDDPRNRRPAARAAGRYHQVRKQRARRYPSARLKHGGWRFFGAGWSADVSPDGALSFDGRSVTWEPRRAQLTFDLSDSILRARKRDPYAAAKLRFMRDTAPWRRSLRAAARKRAERAYFEGLPGRLRALWARRDITMLRRRALLFEIWEECLELGATRDSQLAQQARWMMLRFIRKHLPKGGPHAFTGRELQWMSKRRRGQAPFQPYVRLRRPLLDTGK